jgi:hypothetical protein
MPLNSSLIRGQSLFGVKPIAIWETVTGVFFRKITDKKK